MRVTTWLIVGWLVAQLAVSALLYSGAVTVEARDVQYPTPTMASCLYYWAPGTCPKDW